MLGVFAETEIARPRLFQTATGDQINIGALKDAAQFDCKFRCFHVETLSFVDTLYQNRVHLRETDGGVRPKRANAILSVFQTSSLAWRNPAGSAPDSKRST